LRIIPRQIAEVRQTQSVFNLTFEYRFDSPIMYDNDRDTQPYQTEEQQFCSSYNMRLLFECFSLMTPQPAKLRAPFIVTTAGRSMRRHGN
jgi:hypothetical protein